MSLNVYNQHWENAEYQAQVPFSPFLPLGHSHQANMEAAKLSEDDKHAILRQHEGIDNGIANQQEYGGKNSNFRPE